MVSRTKILAPRIRSITSDEHEMYRCRADDVAGVPNMAPAAEPASNPFFALCIDTHDAKHRSLKQQAEMLKELGYDGVGHLWLDNVAERLKTLDEAGLKLYQISIVLDMTPGKQAYPPAFKDVLPLLKGRQVQFDLLVNGGKLLRSVPGSAPRWKSSARCPTWPAIRAPSCCSIRT